jgi:autophagy-related protein 17
MNRDTEELPVIIGELDDAYGSIDAGQCVTILSHFALHLSHTSEKLQAAKRDAVEQLQAQHEVLDDLEELGTIMGEMLQKQTEIEADFVTRLEDLNQHLFNLSELSNHYTMYQHSFRKLLVEVARRRHYKEAADQIVRGMNSQLEAMAEGTSHARVASRIVCSQRFQRGAPASR